MNPYLFISKRIITGNKKNYSANVLKIAVGTVAVGVVVMLLSLFIIRGFKHQIEYKVSGFVGNVQISGYTDAWTTENIFLSPDTLNAIRNVPGVSFLQSFANITGVIKTNDIIEGAMFKGVGSDFCRSCFSGKIIEGNFPSFNSSLNDSVVVSKIIADKLNIYLYDKIEAYFLQNQQPLARKFVVSAIYESGFSDYDKMFVLVDINHVRKLNKWQDNTVGGYEVFVSSLPKIENVSKTITTMLPYYCNVQTMYDVNPQVFDWLDLQDVNVAVLLTVMIVVCIITMISVMLIIIIEKTSMIGILKAVGMRNTGLQKIFLYKSAYLTIIGVIIGDAIALTLSFIQIKWGIISLPQETYYVSTVPVQINFLDFCLVNLLTLLTCITMMLLPAKFISNVNPVKSINFE